MIDDALRGMIKGGKGALVVLEGLCTSVGSRVEEGKKQSSGLGMDNVKFGYAENMS